MKVRNAHTAALTPPGGKHLAPGEVGDANAEHHITKAWLAAGFLAAEEPKRVEIPLEELSESVAAEAPKGRRGGK